MVFKVSSDLWENAPTLSPGLYPDQEEEQLPEYIQGYKVKSKLEARVALALEYFNIKFIYQYKFNGGTQIRGGQLIDFIAKTAPLWTPIYIQGSYWHSLNEKYEDTIKIREFTRATRSTFRDPVILKEPDLQSIDAAKSEIKEKVL